MQMKKWVTFYSQTGSEIKDLITLGHIPDVVVTDNFKAYLSNYEFFKSYGIKQDVCAFNIAKQSKINKYNELLADSWLVTLHGWLNIVPGDICERYNIFNGHPGLITTYPELKGKDPQERAFKDITKYKKIGSVVHKVTEGVDEGEVVAVAEQRINKKLKVNTLNGMYNICSHLSILSWETFFRNLPIILETDLNYDGTFKNDRDQKIPFYS